MMGNFGDDHQYHCCRAADSGSILYLLNRVSEPACFVAAPAPGKREHNFGIF